MPLKDTNCRNAKPQEKPYRLYDEQGLYLEVQPNGGRYWRLKYRFLGKEKRLALGVYPEVGLQEARRKRDDARVQLAGGQDPSLQRRMAKVVSQLDHQHTFESVATQWLSVRESSWDPEYTRTVRQRLELNAYPWLGKLPISSISTPMLVENLQRIIKRGARETARRVAQIYKQIFEFAEAAGITPPNQIGNLSRTLPAKRVKHFAAVTNPEKLGALLKALDSYSGTMPVCCALKLAPLLFCRPGDLRHMEWSEVNLDAGEWLIPGHKMKGLTVAKQDRPDHLVPLAAMSGDSINQGVSAMKKITPNPPTSLFTVAENIDPETLLVQASETLASLNALTTDLAFELEGSHRQKLLASQQLIALGELLVERVLTTLAAPQPSPQ
ncbi:DUF6124 family protein [Pseudomonas sp. B22129]|uniref:DUF6124 family protein n=1 Tax=Pseudomonas sp. B22129 TaxID=3235111 RepID=UPI0037832EC1